MVGRKAQRDRRNWAPLRRAGEFRHADGNLDFAVAAEPSRRWVSAKGPFMNLGEKRKYGAIYADLRW